MARRRVVSLVAGGLLALAAVLAIPGIATAHTPSVTLTCSNGSPVLSISLTSYNSSHNNTVSASIDSSSVLSTTSFGTTYIHAFSAGSSYTSHTAQVVVFAWDDPTGSNHWTKTFNLSRAACETATPSPTQHATWTPTVRPTATLTVRPTATLTVRPTATLTDPPTPTPCVVADAAVDPTPCETPFQSFQGETATPASTTTPPPTSTDGNGSGTDSSPLFALLISILFGGLGLAAVQAQRAGVRR